MLDMRNLLTEKQKHLIWKDEQESDFVILKYAEIYRYSKNTLMISCWSRGKALRLIKKGIIIVWDKTDDFCYTIWKQI